MRGEQEGGRDSRTFWGGDGKVKMVEIDEADDGGEDEAGRERSRMQQLKGGRGGGGDLLYWCMCRFGKKVGETGW